MASLVTARVDGDTLGGVEDFDNTLTLTRVPGTHGVE